TVMFGVTVGWDWRIRFTLVVELWWQDRNFAASTRDEHQSVQPNLSRPPGWLGDREFNSSGGIREPAARPRRQCQRCDDSGRISSFAPDFDDRFFPQLQAFCRLPLASVPVRRADVRWALLWSGEC